MIEEMLVAFIGTLEGMNGRIFPLYAPPKEPRPFIVYTPRGTTEENSLSGYLGFANTVLELVVTADSYRQMKELSAMLVEALKDFGDGDLQIHEDSPEEYDTESGAFRKAVSIKIVHDLD